METSGRNIVIEEEVCGCGSKDGVNLGQLNVLKDTSVFTVHHVVVLLVLKKQYAHVETYIEAFLAL